MGKEHFLYYSTNPARDDAPGLMSLTSCDEAAIWEKFLKGDDSALSYIYRSYVNKLYNYGRQFADEELARDCVQDLFFDLINARKKLRHIVSVKAYLFAVLRRKIIRKLKQKGREIEESKLDNASKFRIAISSDGSTPIDEMISGRLELLKEACNALPTKQREAIMLYYYEKLSYKEIAEIFEMSKVSSARILVYRALDTLKKLLENVKDDLVVLILGMASLRFFN